MGRRHLGMKVTHRWLLTITAISPYSPQSISVWLGFVTFAGSITMPVQYVLSSCGSPRTSPNYVYNPCSVDDTFPRFSNWSPRRPQWSLPEHNAFQSHTSNIHHCNDLCWWNNVVNHAKMYNNLDSNFPCVYHYILPHISIKRTVNLVCVGVIPLAIWIQLFRYFLPWVVWFTSFCSSEKNPMWSFSYCRKLGVQVLRWSDSLARRIPARELHFSVLRKEYGLQKNTAT